MPLLCLCTTHFCIRCFQSVTGLHAVLCTWFFRSEQKWTALQRTWTHKCPTKVNAKKHTQSNKGCFEKKSYNNIFCHRYAQSEAQRLCQGPDGQISVSGPQTDCCYCATLCEYYCMYSTQTNNLLADGLLKHIKMICGLHWSKCSQISL